MIALDQLSSCPKHELIDDALFSRIALDIELQGYSIRPFALPDRLTAALATHLQTMNDNKFRDAGIGRGEEYLQNHFVRSDEICWISGESPAGQQWLHWITGLQDYLNRRLFLGLFSFESHFAHYRPGDFYKRHYDTFRGEANRILSVAAYFNSDWTPADGGELVLYMDDSDKVGIKVQPLMGTLVAFLSEDFPHEVLPARRDRYSIAGWFRLNTSIGGKVDPPL